MAPFAFNQTLPIRSDYNRISSFSTLCGLCSTLDGPPTSEEGLHYVKRMQIIFLIAFSQSRLEERGLSNFMKYLDLHYFFFIKALYSNSFYEVSEVF